MPERERNLEIVNRLWDAASRGELDPGLVFAEDVVWRTYGDSHVAGTFHGIEAMHRHLANTSASVDDMRSELLDVLAGDHGAVVVYRTVAMRGPKQMDSRIFLWLGIHDGVIRSVAAVPWDQAQDDAFWRLE